MTCEDTQHFFDAYVDDELDWPVKLAVDLHLQGCAHCAGVLSSLRSLVSTLKRAALHFNAPPHLKAMVQADIQRADAKTRHSSAHWPWAGTTTALLLVAAFAWALFVLPAAHPAAGAAPRFKAIAFDAFVLFNPDSVVPEVERVFPGKGREFTNLWRTRQFEYSWLRSITGRYVDFSAVTDDALVYTAGAMKLELTPDDRSRLLNAYSHLTPWSDTVDALSKLKKSGLRIITLTNFSPTMLRSNADNAGLTGYFDFLVNTDANHTYKPDPRAYQLGIDQLHLGKQDILYVAFGGWDVAGAKAFGYPTFWVNRFNQPLEELSSRPDETSANLDGLLRFVKP